MYNFLVFPGLHHPCQMKDQKTGGGFDGISEITCGRGQEGILDKTVNSELMRCYVLPYAT